MEIRDEGKVLETESLYLRAEGFAVVDHMVGSELFAPGIGLLA